MARFFNLNSIQYFEAVARHSRVSLAAEELSVSTSAVSQQIRSLETALGVPLFRRLKRRLVLTEEGERLYLSANEALRLLHGTHDRITRRHKSTSLILRVSISFGVSWLGPRIAGFIDANPRWNMHIDGTQAITDFEKEGGRPGCPLRLGRMARALCRADRRRHRVAVVPPGLSIDGAGRFRVAGASRAGAADPYRPGARRLEPVVASSRVRPHRHVGRASVRPLVHGLARGARRPSAWRSNRRPWRSTTCVQAPWCRCSRCWAAFVSRPIGWSARAGI